MARRKGPDLSVAELESLLAQQKSRVTNLGKKRAELQAELKTVERQLQSLQGSTRRTDNKSGRRGKRPQNAHSLASVVTRILEKSPKGLNLEDLTKQVVKSGYQTKAKSFSNVVYQCVYNSEAIRRDKKHGTYRLRASQG